MASSTKRRLDGAAADVPAVASLPRPGRPVGHVPACVLPALHQLCHRLRYDPGQCLGNGVLVFASKCSALVLLVEAPR